MRSIAEHGARVIYEGDIAREMVERVRSHVRPGTLALADLSSYRSSGATCCGLYRRWTVCGMPAAIPGGIASG